MTPSEIRSLYVETLARHEWEDHNLFEMKTWKNHSWATQNELIQSTYRRAAERTTAALDAAGLLPTKVDGRYIGSGLQRRTRYVTEWQEATQ